MNRKRLFFILFPAFISVLCIFLFTCSFSFAADYYVNPSGNNGNPGTSSGSPWRTITYAIGQASAGDTIYLASGTYSNSNNGETIPVVINKNLTMTGAGSTSSIIDAESSDRGITCTEATATSLTISNLRVTNGSATNGGGIYYYVPNGTFTIQNCTIDNNTAVNSGGGIFTRDASLTLSGTTIQNNYAELGAGVNAGVNTASAYTLTVSITDCTFTSNNANQDTSNSGGGLYSSEVGTSTISLSISRCTFNSNTVTGGNGGAIYTSLVNAVNISNSLFYGQTVSTIGGAFYFYTTSANPSTVSIINSTVTNNTASDGGGINLDNDITFTTKNTIFSNNSGYAILCNSSTNNISEVSYCNFYGNGTGPFTDLTNNYTTASAFDADTTNITFTHSNNIDGNPLYVSNPNYRLQTGSPCIDAATSSGAPSNDLDGNSRPYGSGYDIGAYENQGDTSSSSTSSTTTSSTASSTIRGTVYNSLTLGTISSPTVSIYNTNNQKLSSITSNPYSFSITSSNNYYLQVEKEGYTFPSSIVDGKTTGDHGELFTASGNQMTIDIPLDEGYPLEATKTANKKIASIGDIITYNVQIKNKSTVAFSNIIVKDQFKDGFKYITGSTYLDSSKQPDPSYGSDAIFSLGTISGSTTVNLTYQVRAGTGLVPGKYKTTIVAEDSVRDWQMSNADSYELEIINDALFEMGTILGKVFYDLNGNRIQDKDEPGIKGVRIATEYGVIVTTDEDGKYHIADVPPKTHLLKIDTHSLPKGSVLSTETVYVVKMTEGLLSKVSFGVKPPEGKLFEELESVSKELTFSITENTAIITPKLNIEYEPETGLFHIDSNYAVYISGWKIDIKDKQGNIIATLQGEGPIPPSIVWNAEETSDDGIYFYRLSVTDNLGKTDSTRLKTLPLLLEEEISEGKIHNFAKKKPTYYGNDIDEEQNIFIPESSSINIQGTSYQNSTVIIAANDVQVKAQTDKNGNFSTDLILPYGTHNITVTSEDGMAKAEEEIALNENYFFLVALGEGILRNLNTSGNIDMVDHDDRFEDGLRVDGRLSFYLKARVKGKFLITAGVDTDRERNELFTNLDPDRYYPVYGDASNIDWEANDTQDEFYLLVQMDKSHLKWGSFNTEFIDTDLAIYNRTLHGANAEYISVGNTKYGDPWTKVKGFYAKARQLAAHDEFLGTGGSLYYLSNEYVIEGSQKVKIEIRDNVSNILLNEIDLREEIDYEIDYTGGRILLTRPLNSVTYNYRASIISNDILNGNRVYLIVDYEYMPQESIRKEAWGIRASQQLGSHIRVGGTYVNEEKNAHNYELAGGDVTLKLDKSTELTAEYAHSRNTQLPSSYSVDGGLSFTKLSSTVNDDKSGDAFSIKGKTSLIPKTDITGYFITDDPDFFISDSMTYEGTRKYGGSIITQFTENLLVGVKHTTQKLLKKGNELSQAVSKNFIGVEKANITTALLEYTPGKWDFRTEYQHSEGNDDIDNYSWLGLRRVTDNDLLGARLGYRFNERIHTYLGGQGTLSGESNNQGYIGVDLKLWKSTSLNIKETIGNLGNSTLLGLTSKVSDDTNIFTTIETGRDNFYGPFNKTTWGQTTQIDPTSKVYAQTDYSSYQENLIRGNLLGYEKDLRDIINIGDSFGIGVSYERSFIEKEPTAISRDSGSITLSYLNIDWLKIFSKLEVREDRNTEKNRQWVTQNNLMWRINQAISLLGRFNYSATNDRKNDETEAEFKECGIGIAYRPVQFDRLNFLAKYSHLEDLGPEAQTSFSEITHDRRNVWAAEGAYDVFSWLQLVGKFAYRNMEEKVGAREFTDSDTYLYLGRLNFHITKKWDIYGEYRVLHNRQADDQRSGWLVEVDRDIGDYVSLGVGYNFTDFDDDLSNDDYKAKGWFVRAIGKY